MRKFSRLVKQAKALYPYKNQGNDRYLYLCKELTPQPTPEEKEKIDVHLEAISMLRSNQGIDSTPEERNQYLGVERYHMQKIRQIHEAFYWSVVIQSEL